MLSPDQIIRGIAIWAIPVIFAITLHEVAHGFVAWKRGDPTAMLMGRLTINPIKHIDPIGTVLLPAFLLILGSPIIFGWAKPVPVNFEGLHDPKRDMVWVALAGPAANFLMALFWTGVLWVGGHLAGPLAYISTPMQLMGVAGITINLILMVLNLVPIPPLDGGRVAVGLLPGRASYALGRLEPYGMIILILLLFTGVLQALIGPPIFFLRQILMHLGGAL